MRESHPKTRWIMMSSLVIMVGLISTIVYYFPYFVQWVNTIDTSMVIKSSSSVTASDHQPDEPILTSSLSEENPVTKIITSHTASANQPKFSEKTAISSMKTLPVSTKPVTPAPEPIQLETPLPPQSTTLSLRVKKRIERLVAKAQRQMRQTRFTSPEGDNAYETYQSLFKLDPQQARPILEDIVTWYFEQANKSLKQEQLIQLKPHHAYQMYQKIHEIAPQHRSTQMLFNRFFETLKQRAEQQIRKAQWDNAFSTIQELITLAPENSVAQDLLQKLIEQLMAKAQEQMVKHRYTTPAKDNAADTYQQILKISPENRYAKEGLDKIVQIYYQLATRKQRQGRYTASLLWLERGLEVAPNDDRLIRLQQEIQAQLAD